MATLYITHNWRPPTDPKVSFEAKHVLVTGANTGLGFEAAAKFVALNASRVILGVRDLKKGEQAKSSIEERTGKKDRVEVWQLDMNSYDSVQEFAKKASRLDHLDVAVLNAGAFMVSYQQSKYGWEETMQVNVLSTALLAMLLLPKLKASNRESLPVLEFLSSEAYEMVGTSNREDVRREAHSLLQSYNDPKTYNAGVQYRTSKLFVMFMMQTLASITKLPDSGKPGVVITAVCPGLCKSGLSRGLSGLAWDVIRGIANALALRTTEEGSRTLVSGVTLGKEGHGGFWQHDILKPLSPLVSGEEGEELRRRVWSEIVEGLKKDVPDLDGTLAQLEAR